ncbi:MAG: hypothetical protein F4069_09235 [Rhodothermaceae bacterium]|nr:hypothetical protein [Rhodothermaceae bacterium]MYG70555.1 hypothetical protein [Rhodothermaceae bacterium]MYJ45490.1 hypothetical protein [Rhodothermaceae bacterium]
MFVVIAKRLDRSRATRSARSKPVDRSVDTLDRLANIRFDPLVSRVIGGKHAGRFQKASSLAEVFAQE